MCFTGRAIRARRCKICFASTHTKRECAQHGDPDPDVTSRMRTLETAVIALAGPGAGASAGGGGGGGGGPLELQLPACRFTHPVRHAESGIRPQGVRSPGVGTATQNANESV